MFQLQETGPTGRFNPLAMLAHSASGVVEGWTMIAKAIVGLVR